VECHGDNTSIVLDHDSVGAVVDALTAVETAAVEATARPVMPALPQADPAPTAAKAPPKARAKTATKTATKRSARGGPDRARLIELGYLGKVPGTTALGYTDAFVATVAELYMAASDTYVSPVTGMSGRTIAVAEQLDVSMNVVRNAITKARKTGVLPAEFKAARGRTPAANRQAAAEGVEKLRALVNGQVLAEPQRVTFGS
jgi:hypothetical protein